MGALAASASKVRHRAVVSDASGAGTTRNFLNWGKALKPSVSTLADVPAELAKMNDDSGYDSRFILSSYYNWVKGGFRPTNGAIATSGEAAIRPGAVPLDFAFETSGDHKCGSGSADCRFRPAVVANEGQ